MSSEAANSSKDYYGDPPQLLYDVPSSSGIQTTDKEPNLPVDILLLTVQNDEFLACYQQLKNPCRWWFDDLGYVYFEEEDESQKEKVKIALFTCYGGSGGPGGSQISVKNAVTVLRPKAVISVGACSGLNPAKTKLGDVIVSTRLSTYASKLVMSDQEQSTGLRTYVSNHFLKVTKTCAYGWQAPLKNPEASQAVEVHCGEILSGPEQIQAECRRDQLAKCNLMAMAVEMEGEGVFTASFDSGIEWLIVKGIADYAVSSSAQQNAKSWRRCACVMASSLVMHILSNPTVFLSWPHYKGRVAGIKRSAECVEVERSVKSLKSDVADVQLRLTQVEEKQSSAEPPIIPEFADCESDIRLFAARCHENTRQWLFEDFEKWFSDPGDSRAYVLLGDPGVGKSVIAGALAKRKRDAGCLAAAYFCRHEDRRRNHPLSLLATLARDLCKCSSEYSSIVGGEEGVRKLITNSEFNLEVHELFAKLLEEPLAKCRSPPNRRLVIIDALDETECGSRKDFLNVIKVYFPLLPDWLVFFITSRPEDQIRSRLNRYKPCIKICAGVTDRGSFYQQQEKDIQRFLEKEIDFSHLPFSVEDVTKKCSGLFLYAFCVVEELKDSAHSGEVTQLSQLNDFPDDINEFFLKNFQRVFDKVGRDLYTKLLGCIMAAPSPLPVSFIAFVLKRENSAFEKYDVINAVSQFLVQRTSDQTVSFLHNLIPVWLSDEGQARLLYVDKKTACEYLKNIFLDILYIVVGIPPPTLSSEWIDGDLQNYILRFAIYFLCQCGDNASLEGVYKFLTSYIFLQERIKMDSLSLLYDLRLAVHRFPLGLTLERDVISKLEEIIDLSCENVLSCSPYVLKSVLSVSDIVRDNIWSVHQWQLEGCFHSSHDYDFSFRRSFTVTSDKKLVVGALNNPPRIFVPDAVTGKTAAGPFEIPTDVIGPVLLYDLMFSPDDKFLFFGRLDKWFSVEQGCVVDLPQFSGNSVLYNQPGIDEGKYFCVSPRIGNLCDCWPCQNKHCITDLLALWALLEIEDTGHDDMTCTFPQLSDTVSKIKMPLGKPTSKLLEFLGIDPKLYEASEETIPYDPSSCDCCFRLTEVAKSDKEPSLTAVRQLVLEFYPRLFVEQVWNFNSGKPLLHEWWSQNEEFEIINYCLYCSQQPRDVLRWCAGFLKSWSVSNIAVMNAVHALMLFSDHINF